MYSGYGASDLTIGMAGECDLSVWLRRALLTNDRLRTAVLGEDEHRTPMIFQYNPLETYLETTADDELLVTLNSPVLMPQAALRHRRRGEDHHLPRDARGRAP